MVCADKFAPSTCRTRSAETDSPGWGLPPLPEEFPPCAARRCRPHLHRGLQPALNVQQHPRTVCMMTNRLEHQLPINAVEIGFYVEIEHPVVAPTALTSLA